MWLRTELGLLTPGLLRVSIPGDAYHQATVKHSQGILGDQTGGEQVDRLWVKRNLFKSCVCQLLVG